MRIRANSWDCSFVWYYVTEHVLLTTLVAGGLPLFILFSGSGRRSSSVENLIEFMTGHPHQILGLIIGIVVLMNLLPIVVRRQVLVVRTGIAQCDHALRDAGHRKAHGPDHGSAIGRAEMGPLQDRK